ncbi:MAG: sulfite exporter TauE/SafE family protein [Firmicutes bacterium]|nr:sulfite exporter TauE/SafE family protein [Bacillota bacterium]
MQWLAAGLIFLVSGFFAMLGMGGGMLHVPILIWLGYDLKQQAQPIGILLNGLTGLVALVTYARHRLVDWKGGLPMAGAALVLAPAGALTARLLPDRWLVGLFAGVVLAAAIRTLRSAADPDPDHRPPLGRRLLLGSLGAGLAAFLGGMLGLGGGTFVSPLLMWMGYPTKEAVATTAYIVTFSSFSGFVGRMGYLSASWSLVLLLALAAVAAAAAGSHLMATRAKPHWVKVAYSMLLMGVGVKLLW